MKRVAIYFESGDYGEMLVPLAWNISKTRKFIEVRAGEPVHAIVPIEGSN